MKVDGNTLRQGYIIEHNNSLWRVVKTQHVKPGKGGAFLQCELKDIRNNTKLNERFRASQSVERVRLEQRTHQFLFLDGEQATFMDQKTYEQVSLKTQLVGKDAVPFLQDGLIVDIEFHEEEPLGVTLPQHITLEVVAADAVVKGQTATSSYKPAVMENGIRVMVPPYIGAGTRIVVNTGDSTFVERAKN